MDPGSALAKARWAGMTGLPLFSVSLYIAGMHPTPLPTTPPDDATVAPDGSTAPDESGEPSEGAGAPDEPAEEEESAP